jgi:hypothetical protein
MQPIANVLMTVASFWHPNKDRLYLVPSRMRGGMRDAQPAGKAVCAVPNSGCLKATDCSAPGMIRGGFAGCALA